MQSKFGVIPREPQADPAPLPLKNGQFEFSVPKDAQCSKTYDKPIFRLFEFFFVKYNFWLKFLEQIFRQKK